MGKNGSTDWRLQTIAILILLQNNSALYFTNKTILEVRKNILEYFKDKSMKYIGNKMTGTTCLNLLIHYVSPFQVLSRTFRWLNPESVHPYELIQTSNRLYHIKM